MSVGAQGFGAHAGHGAHQKVECPALLGADQRRGQRLYAEAVVEGIRRFLRQREAGA